MSKRKMLVMLLAFVLTGSLVLTSCSGTGNKVDTGGVNGDLRRCQGENCYSF
ncbi:hypothetical protein DFR58_10775 [Anaerobacterium chartisolvens]|uniref:Small secreted protein n=1 Tax=Anaerobacterium chartisolvens TaxID=1297424 RepID=A0A369B7M2_9FIRM|nr:hypothetical protein [Anaerobacterium chartisolvens]RCX17529.1 hypothetical protein DFR58_10775 [Anaerobacterium chartisolvens]